jgi:signal transduction histidine kinase
MRMKRTTGITPALHIFVLMPVHSEFFAVLSSLLLAFRNSMRVGCSRVSSSALYIEPGSVPILVCSVGVLSYLVPLLEGKLIANPQTVWPLWPSCAILVAGLMFVETRIWPLMIGVSFAGIILFDLQVGVSVKSIGWFILGDTVEVLIAGYGLRYCFGGVPQLNTIDALAKYSFFAVLLGPFFAAFLTAHGVRLDFWDGWRICVRSEVLASVTVTPFVMSWGSHYLSGPRRSRSYYLECALQLFGLFVFSFLAFTSSREKSLPVLLYALLPFLLWAALRLGPTGVSTSIMVVCFLTVWGAVHGRGPFAEGGPMHDPSSIQLFLVFAASLFMILNAVVEERKRTQELLSNVGGRLIHAQEQERIHIARELHDDIGQRVALVSVMLGQTAGSLPEGSAIVREQISDVCKQVIQIGSDIQTVSHELHYSTLDLLGLTQAAKGWCQQIGQRRHIDILFRSRDIPISVSQEVSLCIFRILQESVQNACKHSEVKKIEVDIWGDNNAIHLEVSDSGKGFNTKAESVSKGLGLTSMQERARLLRGKVEIDSKPMRGTTIAAHIPLGHDSQRYEID